MGAPELPLFGDDDLKSTQIIHQEISSDESEDETLMNTYYYQPLLADENSTLSQVESTITEHNANYNETPITINTTNIDELSFEMENSNEELVNVQRSDNNLPSIIRVDAELEHEVWNQPRPQELQIELDSNKTQQILNAMSNFNLSNITMPEWAIGVPEEHWKELLLERIGHRKFTEQQRDQSKLN